ncbi:MAG: pilus assembly protein PilM [Candidatus Omnitrophica bacterium]|nr:pilus assembly protein PilM [Candidatus Omnitrophota bacterium]
MKKGLTSIIEISDAHVKYLQCRVTSGKITILSCVIKRFVNRTDEEVSTIITQILKNKNIKKQPLVFLVPRRLIILKSFKLPALDTYEIAKMIPLQLVNKIPYALKDVVYDYDVIEKSRDGYSKLLVSVIHKDISNRYINLLKRSGVECNRLTVSSEGLLGWVTYQQSHKTLNAKDSIAIVNIDTAHVEVCFCHKHHLIFSRSLKYGAKDLAGEYTDDLLQQIKVTFDSYKKEELGPEPVSVVVVSGLAEAAGFSSELGKLIGIPAENRMPLDGMGVQKNSGTADLNNDPGMSAAATVGVLAMDPRAKGLNLTPQEVHEIKAMESKKKEFIVFLLLAVLVGILALSVLGIEFLKKTKELEAIEEKVVAVEARTRKSEQMIKLVEVFDQEFKSRILISDLVNELYTLTPDGISFRSLFLDENGMFTINGYAEESVSVNDFQNSLVNSPVFNDVTLQYATKRKIFNMDITDFKIIAQLANQRQAE